MNLTTVKSFVGVLSALVLLNASTSAQSPAAGTVRISLREAAERVADVNPLVQAAHLDFEASEKQLSKAWREYMPTISANARYSYLDDDLALKVNPLVLPLAPGGVKITIPGIHLLDRSTVRADISATMPIFTGLRIESGIRAARHAAREATAQDTLTLARTVAQALLAYNQALLASENTAAREEARATVARHHHDVELLRAQGIATQYDLIRASLAVADADRALEDAKNQQTLSRRMLRKVLSLPDDAVLDLSDSLDYQDRTVDLNAALQEAQACRAELHALDERQETVRAASAAEIGKMLPQIGAFARYELIDKSLTQLDPKWVVGVGASLTIFNGLKDLASSQAFDIQEKKIGEVRQDVSNSIALEVHKYYCDMETAKRNIVTARTGMELASEALRMATRRFETGTGTSLEVIDAQTGMVANRTAYAAALYAYRSSYIQLVRALGRTAELLGGVFN